MDKSKLVHLKNKYPNCYVGVTGSCIEVIDANNNVIVSLAKNAHGEYADRKDEVGALHAFDLSPIPREARLFKLHKDGKVGKDESYEERKAKSQKLCDDFGYVPSIVQLKALKLWDDQKEEYKPLQA